MNIRLQVSLILGTLLFAVILIRYLIKRKLHLKYSLIWIFAVVVLFVAALFPELIRMFASFMGISTPSNFIFIMFGLFSLLIIFTLTGIVSHMNARIFRLVQYQAILEERLRKLENNADAAESKSDIN